MFKISSLFNNKINYFIIKSFKEKEREEEKQLKVSEGKTNWPKICISCSHRPACADAGVELNNIESDEEFPNCARLLGRVLHRITEFIINLEARYGEVIRKEMVNIGGEDLACAVADREVLTKVIRSGNMEEITDLVGSQGAMHILYSLSKFIGDTLSCLSDDHNTINHNIVGDSDEENYK